LPRSATGTGVQVEHPTTERPGPLSLVCYAFGADVTGCPRCLCTTPPAAS
jgi:hypothetical protein